LNKQEQEPTFEQAVKRLEEIVEKLEEGRVPLDESLQLFEEGVKLSRFCNNKLEEIERKIEILTKNGKGDLITEEFDNNDDLI
jgi:exodeoxyribonuclease VII small subunit